VNYDETAAGSLVARLAALEGKLKLEIEVLRAPRVEWEVSESAAIDVGGWSIP
jgi:hypothetical protein